MACIPELRNVDGNVILVYTPDAVEEDLIAASGAAAQAQAQAPPGERDVTDNVVSGLSLATS